MIPHGPHVRWTILLHSQKSKGRAVDAWAVLRLGSLTAQLQLINTPQFLGWELDFLVEQTGVSGGERGCGGRKYFKM